MVTHDVTVVNERDPGATPASLAVKIELPLAIEFPNMDFAFPDPGCADPVRHTIEAPRLFRLCAVILNPTLQDKGARCIITTFPGLARSVNIVLRGAE